MYQNYWITYGIISIANPPEEFFNQTLPKIKEKLRQEGVTLDGAPADTFLHSNYKEPDLLDEGYTLLFCYFDFMPTNLTSDEMIDINEGVSTHISPEMDNEIIDHAAVEQKFYHLRQIISMIDCMIYFSFNKSELSIEPDYCHLTEIHMTALFDVHEDQFKNKSHLEMLVESKLVEGMCMGSIQGSKEETTQPTKKAPHLKIVK